MTSEMTAEKIIDATLDKINTVLEECLSIYLKHDIDFDTCTQCYDALIDADKGGFLLHFCRRPRDLGEALANRANVNFCDIDDKTIDLLKEFQEAVIEVRDALLAATE